MELLLVQEFRKAHKHLELWRKWFLQNTILLLKNFKRKCPFNILDMLMILEYFLITRKQYAGYYLCLM